MSSAPGLASAIALITSRIPSVTRGEDAEDFLHLLRAVLEEEDPLILTSAIATLATAALILAAAHIENAEGEKAFTPESLLRIMALEFHKQEDREAGLGEDS